MTNEEAIRVLNVAKAECEWNAPLEYQEAFDAAIKALIEQSKHDQNSMSKQPDLETLGIKTEKTCEDAISRQAAIDVILSDKIDDASLEIMTALGDGRLALTLNSACDRHIQEIEKLPPAQPERKKGKWNFIGDNMFECACCGTPYTTQQLNGLRNYNTDPYAPKFCPNCGADMRGEADGD